MLVPHHGHVYTISCLKVLASLASCIYMYATTVRQRALIALITVYPLNNCMRDSRKFEAKIDEYHSVKTNLYLQTLIFDK